VCCGGGDAPGLNGVLRAVVRTAHIQYGWEVTGIFDGFEGLIGKTNTKRLTPWNTRGILFRGGTILGTTNRGNPFAFKATVKGKQVEKDLSDSVIKNIRKLGFDAIVVIGGDGSLHIAYKLFQKGVKVIGVPKTIDNDLRATHITFGFRTAVETATDALDKLHTTAESHHRVMVVELMGRYAGWIALEAGIAGSADVILIPEIPYDIAEVMRKIIGRKKAGCHSSIIVVAEGAKPVGGEMTVLEKDSSGYALRLSGIGNSVGDAIRKQRRMRVTASTRPAGRFSCAFDRSWRHVTE
jgi:6-phosphofructokinase 1